MTWQKDPATGRWTATEGDYKASVARLRFGWMWMVEDGAGYAAATADTLREAQECAEAEIRRRRAR